MNWKKFNRSITIFLLILILLLLLPVFAYAKTMNLTEAVEYGLKNNSDLKKQQQAILDLKRELARLQAAGDWQVNMNADFEIYREEFNGEDSGGIGETVGEKDSIDFRLQRELSSGLKISPLLSLETEEFDSTFTLDLEQQILPRVPTDRKRNKERLELDLVKAEREFEREKNRLLISWLEDYLDLSRREQEINIGRQRMKIAEKNYRQAQEKKSLGESGKAEVLSAQLEVKNREIELQEQINQYEAELQDFYNNLSLPENTELKINSKAEMINMLRERCNSEFDPWSNEDLWQKVKDKNYQLLVKQEEERMLKKELTWLEGEDGPALNLLGEYNSSRDEITVGISLSHIFSDGGQRELEIEKKEEKIDAAGDDYTQLLRELNLQLDQYLNQVQEAEMNIERLKLNLEKVELETDIVQQQLAEGAIEDREYREQKLKEEEADIDLSRGEDRLFITLLRVWDFTDPEALNWERIVND